MSPMSGGAYPFRCIECGLEKDGHKRQVVCAQCRAKPAPPPSPKKKCPHGNLVHWPCRICAPPSPKAETRDLYSRSFDDPKLARAMLEAAMEDHREELKVRDHALALAVEALAELMDQFIRHGAKSHPRPDVMSRADTALETCRAALKGAG